MVFSNVSHSAPIPKPDVHSLPFTNYLTHILILSSLIVLGLPSGLFNSGLPYETLHVLITLESVFRVSYISFSFTFIA